MNKTGIEWCDVTVNPVVGCSNNCPYCYARRWAKRQRHRCSLCYEFKPHPHLERLEQLTPSQKPLRVFIDSMWDWNDPAVKPEWIQAILEKMLLCRQHFFLILSKRPSLYNRFQYPRNVWLGASVTGRGDLHRIAELARLPGYKFLSVEPIHAELKTWLTLEQVDWVIIGAETGNRKGKITPKKKWVEKLIYNCRRESIPVFVKDNVGWPEKVQEIPPAMELCRLCDGAGYLLHTVSTSSYPSYGYDRYETCPRCKGTGKNPFPKLT